MLRTESKGKLTTNATQLLGISTPFSGNRDVVWYEGTVWTRKACGLGVAQFTGLKSTRTHGSI